MMALIWIALYVLISSAGFGVWFQLTPDNDKYDYRSSPNDWSLRTSLTMVAFAFWPLGIPVIGGFALGKLIVSQVKK